MSSTALVVCPHCAAVNRLPSERITQKGTCGRCRNTLFTGTPTELDARSLDLQITRSSLPVVVDFWAPWCAPCRAMAPAFAQAAARLEPYFRLAKLNTEAFPDPAATFQIRSIPTLVIFHSGREIARHSGAMDTASIVRWVESQHP